MLVRNLIPGSWLYIMRLYVLYHTWIPMLLPFKKAKKRHTAAVSSAHLSGSCLQLM